MPIPNYKPRYFKENDIIREFSGEVIAKSDYDSALHKIQQEVLDQLRSGNNNPSAILDVISQLRLEAKVLNVTYERSHTKWLYQHVKQVLDDSCAVCNEEPNLKNLGDNLNSLKINEYANSKADLQVHKGNRVRVVEVKEKPDADYPVFECLRNMSAVAAKIVITATKELRKST